MLSVVSIRHTQHYSNSGLLHYFSARMQYWLEILGMEQIEYLSKFNNCLLTNADTYCFIWNEFTGKFEMLAKKGQCSHRSERSDWGEAVCHCAQGDPAQPSEPAVFCWHSTASLAPSPAEQRVTNTSLSTDADHQEPHSAELTAEKHTGIVTTPRDQTPSICSYRIHCPLDSDFWIPIYNSIGAKGSGLLLVFVQ